MALPTEQLARRHSASMADKRHNSIPKTPLERMIKALELGDRDRAMRNMARRARAAATVPGTR